MDFQNLSSLLDPQSVAIVGASPKTTGWPGRIWANLQRFQYQGRVYPVNPRYETLWGLKCYPSLEEVPEVVDNAVIIVPAPLVVDLLKQVSSTKFRSATVLSGGFGEGDDPEGQARKEFLQTFARERDVPVTGPNCMGLGSARSRAILFPDLRLPSMRSGGLAVVSQSGGLLGSLLRAALSRSLGLSYFVSSGNEVVTELSDYLHYFLRDPQTKVVVAIVEGIKDARKFIEVAREARGYSKPVIVLKVGRSPKGIAAALAHTGALAGNDRIFKGACLQHGVVLVSDMDELANTAELFLRLSHLPTGKKAAFIAFSGGLKAFVSDLAYDSGLELPELSPVTEAVLKDLLGVGTSLGNPLDTGWSGLSSQETYLKCVQTVLADPGIDMVAIQEELPQSDVRPDKESNLLALARIAHDHPKPIVIFSMVTQGLNDYGRQFKERCPLAFLEGVHNTIKGLRHLGHFGAAVADFRREHERGLKSLKPLGSWARELLANKNTLTEWECYRILSEYGVDVAKTALAKNAGEAAKAATGIGYPVVLKACVPGVTHKTELGGVRLNLKNSEEIELACNEIEFALKRTLPEIPLEGFLVQEMVAGGVETIIGGINDPQFGPAVMFGLGGQFVELYQDVVFRLAPVTQEEAGEMIRGIEGHPVLTGFRGRPPVDLEALREAIVSVSLLAAAGQEWIESVDINPFVCFEHGGKAVDGVIISRNKIGWDKGIRKEAL